MTRTRLWCCAALTVCVASACASSPPARYYTLSSIAPAGAVSAAHAGAVSAAHAGAPLRVDRVSIPGELDRTQLVLRTAANQVQIDDLARWAGPLDEMIRRVLSADLAQRLPAGMVADPGEPPLGERRQVFVDIQEFYGDAACAVTLRAGWSLRQSGTPGIRATEQVQVPASGVCPDGLAAGMSQALARLSDLIVAKIAP